MRRYHGIQFGLTIVLCTTCCLTLGAENDLEGGNSTKADDYYVYYQGVEGKPGVDFPVHSYIPRTTFDCKEIGDGYYADLETDCQVFHICEDSKKISFLCPNGTIFQQSELICEWWFKVNCTNSPNLYEESAEQLREENARRKLARKVKLERENFGAVMRMEEHSSVSAVKNGRNYVIGGRERTTPSSGSLPHTKKPHIFEISQEKNKLEAQESKYYDLGSGKDQKGSGKDQKGSDKSQNGSDKDRGFGDAKQATTASVRANYVKSRLSTIQPSNKFSYQKTSNSYIELSTAQPPKNYFGKHAEEVKFSNEDVKFSTTTKRSVAYKPNPNGYHEVFYSPTTKEASTTFAPTGTKQYQRKSFDVTTYSPQAPNSIRSQNKFGNHQNENRGFPANTKSIQGTSSSPTVAFGGKPTTNLKSRRGEFSIDGNSASSGSGSPTFLGNGSPTSSGSGSPTSSGSRSPTSSGSGSLISLESRSPISSKSGSLISSGTGSLTSSGNRSPTSLGSRSPTSSGSGSFISLESGSPISSESGSLISSGTGSLTSSGNRSPTSSGSRSLASSGSESPISSGSGSPISSESESPISLKTGSPTSSGGKNPIFLGKSYVSSGGRSFTSSVGGSSVSSGGIPDKTKFVSLQPSQRGTFADDGNSVPSGGANSAPSGGANSALSDNRRFSFSEGKTSPSARGQSSASSGQSSASSGQSSASSGQSSALSAGQSSVPLGDRRSTFSNDGRSGFSEGGSSSISFSGERNSGSSQARGSTSSQDRGSTSSQARGFTSSQARGSTSSQAKGSTSSQAKGSTSSQARGSTSSQARGSTSLEGKTLASADSISFSSSAGRSSATSGQSFAYLGGRSPAPLLGKTHAASRGGSPISQAKDVAFSGGENAQGEGIASFEGNSVGFFRAKASLGGDNGASLAVGGGAAVENNQVNPSVALKKVEYKVPSTTEVFNRIQSLFKSLEEFEGSRVESEETQQTQETASFYKNSFNSLKSDGKKTTTLYPDQSYSKDRTNPYPNHRETYSEIKDPNLYKTKYITISSVTPQYVTTQAINNGKPFIGSRVGDATPTTNKKTKTSFGNPSVINDYSYQYFATTTPKSPASNKSSYLGTTAPRYLGTTTPRYLGTTTPRYFGTTTPKYLATSTSTQPSTTFAIPTEPFNVGSTGRTIPLPTTTQIPAIRQFINLFTSAVGSLNLGTQTVKVGASTTPTPTTSRFITRSPTVTFNRGTTRSPVASSTKRYVDHATVYGVFPKTVTTPQPPKTKFDHQLQIGRSSTRLVGVRSGGDTTLQATKRTTTNGPRYLPTASPKTTLTQTNIYPPTGLTFKFGNSEDNSIVRTSFGTGGDSRLNIGASSSQFDTVQNTPSGSSFWDESGRLTKASPGLVDDLAPPSYNPQSRESHLEKPRSTQGNNQNSLSRNEEGGIFKSGDDQIPLNRVNYPKQDSPHRSNQQPHSFVKQSTPSQASDFGQQSPNQAGNFPNQNDDYQNSSSQTAQLGGHLSQNLVGNFVSGNPAVLGAQKKAQLDKPRPFSASSNSYNYATTKRFQTASPRSYPVYKLSTAAPFTLTSTSNKLDQNLENLQASASISGTLANIDQNFIATPAQAPTTPNPYLATDRTSIYENVDNMINVLMELTDSAEGDKSFETPRPGLVVPPSVGPQTLHTLAVYFANALQEMGKGDEISRDSANKLMEEKFTELLTKMTQRGYDSLFSQKTTEEPPTTSSDDLEGQHSKSPVTSPRIRQLAKVFTQALSAYLDDPATFRKVLEEVRPTEPPILNDVADVNSDDELLNFSDADSKSSYPPIYPTVAPVRPTWGYILAHGEVRNSLNSEGENLQSADSQSFVSQFNKLGEQDKEKMLLPNNHWTSSPQATKLWQTTLSVNPVTINKHLETTEAITEVESLEELNTEETASPIQPHHVINYELRSLPKITLNQTEVHGILIDFMNSSKPDDGSRLQRILRKLNTTEDEFLEKMREIEGNPLTRRLILLLISECALNDTRRQEFKATAVDTLLSLNRGQEALSPNQGQQSLSPNQGQQSLSPNHESLYPNGGEQSLYPNRVEQSLPPNRGSGQSHVSSREISGTSSDLKKYVDVSLSDDDHDARALQLLNSLYTIASRFGK